MRWTDERYVRVYTRDTIDWLSLSFEAQGLLTLILRKVDRAGLLRLGSRGKPAIAVLVGHPTRWSTIGPALDELLADGCVRIDGDMLVVPNSSTRRKRRNRTHSGSGPNARGIGIWRRREKSQTVTTSHKA
ncbi:MAG: hypothetical protein MUF54_20350 [Polyangiaceae bacterium]|nr:hypothetical protein [Polyangiaceae bacterium]